jgi:hypothetical protein
MAKITTRDLSNYTHQHLSAVIIAKQPAVFLCFEIGNFNYGLHYRCGAKKSHSLK